MSEKSATTTVFYPPFTITSVSVQNNVAYATYTDSRGQTVPPGQTTPIAVPQGTTSAAFSYSRTPGLRLVAGTVKTIGSDPTMFDYNFLTATSGGGAVIDTVTVPWQDGVQSTRGVVLLFAQVDGAGNMLGFVPTTDPKIQNGGA